MAVKIYVPKSSAKEKTFRDGGSIIRLSFKADDLIHFVNEHQNEKGWINLNIGKRKSVSDFGETHSVSLDDFVPTKRDEPAKREPEPEQMNPDEIPSDEIPF